MQIRSLFFTGLIFFSFFSLSHANTITHAISLSRAPKYKKDFKHFEYANPDAPKQGILNECAIGTFDSFNPYVLKGRPIKDASLIYDTLMEKSLDEPSSYYCLVAEKIEFPKDYSYVIYHINPDAKFHDGKSIRSEDIIFSYNLLINNFGSVLKKYYKDIKSVETIGELKLKFSFSTKNNKELIAITSQIPAIPKHFWKDKNFSNADLEIPLGSGPYKIKKYQTGRSVTLERVKNYWAKDLPVMKGRYNFDEIRYDYYRDSTIALEAFKAGLFDYRFEDSAKKWATMYNGPEFNNKNILKKKIKHSQPIGMQGLVFNTRRPVFKDPKVRQALIYAFDYEWANKKMFYGEYKRIDSYFSNCELKAPPLPCKKEKLVLDKFKNLMEEKIFTAKYKLPKTDGSGYSRNNLIKASKLLNEAGWEIKNQKLINKKTNKPFRFEYLSVSPTREKIILPFKENLKKLGIKMIIKRVDSPTYTMRIRKYDFDMTELGFGAKLTPGSELMVFWHSSSAFKKDSRNLAGVNSSVIDSLVEQIINEPKRDKMIILVHALDRILLWGNYIIPFGASTEYRLAIRKDIKMPKIMPQNKPGISTWWKEKKI